MARLDRASLRGHAQTVLGAVAPEALGPTLMHEHLLCDIRPPSQRGVEHLGPDIRLDNVWAIETGTLPAARKYLLADVQSGHGGGPAHAGGGRPHRRRADVRRPRPAAGGAGSDRARHRRARRDGLRPLRRRVPGRREPRAHRRRLRRAR